MGQDPQATAPASADAAPTRPFESAACRAAIEQLGLACSDRAPVVALLSEGRDAPRYVVRRVVETLGDDITLIRVTGPCEDVAALLRDVIRGIGFRPRDMDVADLENIFRLFLTFQKNHGRRTLLWVEDAETDNRWVLDKIAELLASELEGRYGLMLVLSGSGRLKKLLNEGLLGDDIQRLALRITIAPFSLAETREYLRRRVEADAGTSIDRLFSYEAVAALHELTGGVPDAVSRVAGRSLEIAGAAAADRVTAEQVARVHAALGAETAGADAAAETVTLDAVPPREARLIVRLDDRSIRELAVGQGHVLLGRSRLCDVRLPAKTVSRQHALIVFAWDGSVTLVDLSSTNGTYVDGYPVSEHPLVSGETIMLGDCRIEYLTGTATGDTSRQPGHSAQRPVSATEAGC